MPVKTRKRLQKITLCILTILEILARLLIKFIVQLQSCDGEKSTDQPDDQRYQ